MYYLHWIIYKILILSNQLSGDCIQGVCNCRNGSYFVPKDKKCYVKSIINQNCTREQNCSVLNSECLRNICKCKRGYEPRENFTMCINNGKFFLYYELIY